MTIIKCLLAVQLMFAGCHQKQPQRTYRVYSAEEICNMEMDAKIAKARVLSPIIDSFIALKQKDSVNFYLDSLYRLGGGKETPEWAQFMARWNELKYGVVRKKDQHSPIRMMPQKK